MRFPLLVASTLLLPTGQYPSSFEPGYFDKAKGRSLTTTDIQTPPLRKLRVTAVYDVGFEIKP